jgi:hypothetical protein
MSRLFRTGKRILHVGMLGVGVSTTCWAIYKTSEWAKYTCSCSYIYPLIRFNNHKTHNFEFLGNFIDGPDIKVVISVECSGDYNTVKNIVQEYSGFMKNIDYIDVLSEIYNLEHCISTDLKKINIQSKVRVDYFHRDDE